LFTGIVQEVGRVLSCERRGDELKLLIACGRLEAWGVRTGDSLCVQGCCLTATEVRRGTFAADVSHETLAVTNLGGLATDAWVNLEPALKAGDALGGHLVSGHVDGVGQVLEMGEDASSRRVRIGVPTALARYLAPKGSVAVDGVSLTINAAGAADFAVNLIPYTLEHSTLGRLAAGARVNLEVDQIARYVDRLLQTYRDSPERR